MSGLTGLIFDLLSATSSTDPNNAAFRPRLVSIAPMSFDVGLLEVIATFCTGGHLYVAHDMERVGPPLAEAVRRHRATHFASTPTVLGFLGDPSSISEDVQIFSGAEPLPADLAERWCARHRLINLYGPTEVTVNAIHGFITPDPTSSAIPHWCGRPACHGRGAGQRPATHPHRYGGRIVAGGRQTRCGIPGHAGHYRFRVCRGPRSPGASTRLAHVPHRRPGGTPARWPVPVPRPRGRSDENPWAAHRACGN